jgi:hypothetical protein
LHCPQGGNGTNEDAVTNLVSAYAFPDLLNDSHRLVANDQARFDRVFTFQDMKIGTADGSKSNAYDCFSHSRPGDGNCFQADMAENEKP